MIASEDDGHVRIHRRLYRHPVFRSLQEASVFAWMVCAAQWREVTVQISNKPVTLQRGDLVASDRELSEAFGIPKTTLRRLFGHLRDSLRELVLSVVDVLNLLDEKFLHRLYVFRKNSICASP